MTEKELPKDEGAGALTEGMQTCYVCVGTGLVPVPKNVEAGEIVEKTIPEHCCRENGDSTARYAAAGCGSGRGDAVIYRLTYHCGCVGYTVNVDHLPQESYCRRHYESHASIEGCSLGSLVDALIQSGVIEEGALFEHLFKAEERPCGCEFCNARDDAQTAKEIPRG